MWKRCGLVAGWMFVAAGWLIAFAVVFPRVPRTGSDFGIFIDAARALRLNPNADIYQPSTLSHIASGYGGCSLWGGPHGGPAYVYPPLLAILLEPLSMLPCAGATYTWHVFNLILWGFSSMTLAWQTRVVSHWQALVIGAVSTAFLPLVQGLIIGQVHVIILACCLAASMLVERKRPVLAGVVLALGTFIKYFPAFLILYYFLLLQQQM